MRKPADGELRKEEILGKCFKILVSRGLEQISIRDFTNATGLPSSSLYYWFRDKDEIILDATEYGMNSIISLLFKYASSHINNIKDMCEGFPKLIKEHSAELKIIIQMATSPMYGSSAVEMSEKFANFYDEYAIELSKQLSQPKEKIRIIIDLFVSSIIDGVIWDDWDKLSSEIDFLLNMFIGDR